MDPIFIYAIVISICIFLGYILFFMLPTSKGSSSSLMMAGKRRQIRYLKK